MLLTQAEQESTSFLKKRSKKLLFAVADFSPGSASRSKSFLVLFFKKEHSFFSIAAGLLLLCGPACAQIRQIIPLPPAKDSGYLAGDMLVMRTLIITGRSAAHHAGTDVPNFFGNRVCQPGIVARLYVKIP
jgi:hypothetical protein